jgi:hypothetical protein
MNRNAALLPPSPPPPQKRLTVSNEVSVSQLAKGFQRVADNLADTALDNPQVWGGRRGRGLVGQRGSKEWGGW